MFWDIEDDIPNVEGLFYAISDDLFCFAEYRKLEVVPGDTNSVDGSEEQILYKGFSPILISKDFLWTCQNIWISRIDPNAPSPSACRGMNIVWQNWK